jgi:hypothetical protein
MQGRQEVLIPQAPVPPDRKQRPQEMTNKGSPAARETPPLHQTIREEIPTLCATEVQTNIKYKGKYDTSAPQTTPKPKVKKDIKIYSVAARPKYTI